MPAGLAIQYACPVRIGSERSQAGYALALVSGSQANLLATLDKGLVAVEQFAQ